MFKKNQFIKPNIALEGHPEIEDDLATPIEEELSVTCSGCKKKITKRELEQSLYVCPHCAYHFRINARDRINLITDEGSFVEHDANAESKNLLGFLDYDEKLKKAKLNSNESESVVTGHCKINGIECAIFVMDSWFMMGSMGTVAGEKISRLFEYSTSKRLSVIGFTASGGARMQEGILSLMQMAKTSGAIMRHGEAGFFYLTMLTDPTTGGVTASFAMEGDIILAEPGALVGFAGQRVIEQTIRKTLPEGFQRAEFLLEKGFVDNIVDRRQQREIISMLLKLHKGGPHNERI
ncbi:MAG: acetyl-CoA carboxylase, carboxyltransferase subunit beta [Eubacteriales bacterium]